MKDNIQHHVSLPDPNKMLIIERIDYQNPYDYKKLHRHDYFELIFVRDGNGSQLIDFSPYDVSEGDIYIIYPGQLHLMNRNTATGYLVQFRKDVFEYINPVRHYHLFFNSGKISCDVNTFNHLYDLIVRIKELLTTTSTSSLTAHRAYSYLQIILITIAELNNENLNHNKEHYILEDYLSLLTDNIHEKKKVSEYCALMNCSAEKLNDACKKSLGKNALELIHEELILEIRRLMLLNELSYKEIAYQLNFDSQGNFNAFIKNKTGLTPKELQQAVLDIYN
ncbi:MAG: helix-turn-helix transcriptional regulator [Flavipsychrobacter sp.]